jgi:polyisoprenoid-binding protein YceI
VSSSTRSRRWPRRLAIGASVTVVLAIAVPFGYIHFVEGKAPAKLVLQPAGTADASATETAAGTVTGTWSVTTGSLVGYRVNEKLLGQANTAVGRTSDVTGTLDITANAVQQASFTAAMASVKSDQSRRDTQFDGRIMDVAKYPTAVFKLTKPIPLAALPAVGSIRSYPATGTLTLRGQTHQVTFTISAERSAAGIEVQGDIPILFATWDVPNPSFGSFVTTANHGTLEFLLKFGHGTSTATTTVAPTTTVATGAGGFKPTGTITPPLTIGG